VLIAILRKRLHLQHSPYTILQILSITLFAKTPILQALAHHPLELQEADHDNQLCFQGI
jgi:hypothetical protein